jgi:hypothetical protein
MQLYFYSSISYIHLKNIFYFKLLILKHTFEGRLKKKLIPSPQCYPSPPPSLTPNYY